MNLKDLAIQIDECEMMGNYRTAEKIQKQNDVERTIEEKNYMVGFGT